MFDPKITKGKWKSEPSPQEIDEMFIFSDGENPTCIATTNQFKELEDGGRKNAKAIAAVPELLEVYKAATLLLDSIDKSVLNMTMNPMFDKNGDNTRFWHNLRKLKEAKKSLEDNNNDV